MSIADFVIYEISLGMITLFIISVLGDKLEARGQKDAFDRRTQEYIADVQRLYPTKK